ncbi:MAG: hypothetical protein AAGC56_03540 [Pseudomonadota bacterium]
MNADAARREEHEAIIGFALKLTENKTAAEAQAVAAERGWLDADGAATAAGRELLASLKDQSGTRTVFRSF